MTAIISLLLAFGFGVQSLRDTGVSVEVLFDIFNPLKLLILAMGALLGHVIYAVAVMIIGVAA